MKKQYFIFQTRKVGIVGSLEKIDEQPDDGFTNENEAIHYLENNYKEGKVYGFRKEDNAHWYRYIILPVYTKQ